MWKNYVKYVIKMKKKYINLTLRYVSSVGWTKLIPKFSDGTYQLTKYPLKSVFKQYLQKVKAQPQHNSFSI